MDPWLQSAKDHERERATASMAQVLKCLSGHLSLKVSSPSVTQEEGSQTIPLQPFPLHCMTPQTGDSLGAPDNTMALSIICISAPLKFEQFEARYYMD